MDKRIKISKEDMCNYFIREQKTMDYSTEFFKELCKINIQTIESAILPLSCYNEMDKLLYSLDNGDKTAVRGGFCYTGKKQAYIRIGIDTNNSILNKNLKQIIRHEIIHYYLWLVDLPFNDDDLEFWCLCYAFDGGAYEELTCEDEEYYNLFIELYDTYIVNLPSNIRAILLGEMINQIKEIPINKYKDFVIDTTNKAKKFFLFK